MEYLCCGCSGFALSHVIEGLMAQTQYKFRIRAGNSMGYSQWSPTITVATIGTGRCLILQLYCQVSNLFGVYSPLL